MRKEIYGVWVEKLPEINDTIKVIFNDISGLGTGIGVFLRISIQGYYICQFGKVLRYLDKNTTFFVWQ